MRGKLSEVQESDGINWQIRSEIQVERAFLDRPDSHIAALFWYWQERAMLEGGVPGIRDFRLSESEHSWVDVTADDPMNFYWQNHAGRVPGNWTGTRLGDHSARIHARATALEYIDCRERRYPTYIHIHQKVLGAERNYVKLTAPLADGNGAVTCVVYAFLPLAFTVLDGGVK